MSALLETRAYHDNDLRERVAVKREDELIDSDRFVELIEAELADVEAADIRERYYLLLATLVRAEWPLNAIAAGCDVRTLEPRSRDAFRDLLRQARRFGLQMQAQIDEELSHVSR